jgi:hypothetical protein
MECETTGSVPFFLEFSVSVIPVISIVIALLEFLIPFVPIFTVRSTTVTSIIIASEAFYIRGVGEFQFISGDAAQFTLDGVVVYGFFVPIIVGQFHVISHRICKSILLIRILFLERL